jgi:hypothetical protein
LTYVFATPLRILILMTTPSRYKERHGQDPSDETVQQWLDTMKDATTECLATTQDVE